MSAITAHKTMTSRRADRFAGLGRVKGGGHVSITLHGDGVLAIIRTGIVPPEADAIAYRDGLPVAEFCAFAEQVGLSEADLAKALGFSPATATRRKAKDTPLTPEESDALIGAAKIFYKASLFFDRNGASAARWMLRACPAFGGRTPMECVRFGEKRARVLEFLDAGIHGVAFA